MTVGQIFTKIGNFIENKQIFMVINCNCTKLPNFEDFKTCLGGYFSWTQCIFSLEIVKRRYSHQLTWNVHFKRSLQMACK